MSADWVHMMLGPVECPVCGEHEGLRIMRMERVPRSGGNLTKLGKVERSFAERDERMDFSNGGGLIHVEGECLHEFDIALSIHNNQLFVANCIVSATRETPEFLRAAAASAENRVVEPVAVCDQLGAGDSALTGETVKLPLEGEISLNSDDSDASETFAAEKPRKIQRYDNRPLSESELEDIAARYLRGDSISSIKRDFGIHSSGRFYKILANCGVTPNRSSKDDSDAKQTAPKKPVAAESDKIAGNAVDTFIDTSDSVLVAELPLISGKLIDQLHEASIKTVDELCEYTRNDLIQYGIGQGSIITLERALASVGACLSVDGE